MVLQAQLLVKEIGVVVALGERDGVRLSKENLPREPTTFDYFCEKNMLALLVDMLLSVPSVTNDNEPTHKKRQSTTDEDSVVSELSDDESGIYDDDVEDEEGDEEEGEGQASHPPPSVASTPPLKSTVYTCLSLLFKNVSSDLSLFYLCSQGFVKSVLGFDPLKRYYSENENENEVSERSEAKRSEAKRASERTFRKTRVRATTKQYSIIPFNSFGVWLGAE